MDEEISTKHTQIENPLRVMYALGTILAFAFAIPIYFTSTFLSTFMSTEWVGILYSLSSVLGIIGLAITPRILRKYGNYKTSIFMTSTLVFLLLALGFLSSPVLIGISFILYSALLMVIVFSLDVFLESYSSDESTGGTRGIYLTLFSVAFVVSPLIAGFLLGDGDYWKLFSASAVFMVAVTAVIALKLRKFKDPHYESTSLWRTCKKVWATKDIYKIFMANFLLRFFYALMVIYTPIYLNQQIGFDWDEIGIIFTIMLLPFIIFEIPAGKIADKWLGEKELLSGGFLLIALTTGALFFITSTSMVVWAAALFMTRVGASIIEIMTESYFFKQIDATNTQMIGFYRNTRPLAYLFAPIIATVFLAFFEYQYLFLALGAMMLYGLRYSLTIKDTK